MCRLFGMSAAPCRVRATFWLLDAPDSLRRQSWRNPDGTGIGVFGPDGQPEIHKETVPAHDDRRFAQEARRVESTTFVAHVRHASTGDRSIRNTHPFVQHGRLLAHNGVLEGLATLEGMLGDYRDLVQGDTDSERLFALITRRVDEHDGDIRAGITAAARDVAAEVPVYSMNLVLTTPDELWALRYPAANELHVLERASGGPTGSRHLDHAGSGGHIRVRSIDLATAPAVVVASEQMDEDPGWSALAPGELLHVDRDLVTDRELVLPTPPTHELRLADLRPEAAESQRTPMPTAH
jgi:glutamine amidotransferase